MDSQSTQLTTDKPRAKIRDNKCGCTGSRSCLLCEAERNDKFILFKQQQPPETIRQRLYYCIECGNKAWPRNLESHEQHLMYLSDDVEYNEVTPYLQIEDITIIGDVITQDEERYLVDQIDSGSWINSQSGRRKQDFGPKINFKKQKISLGTFKGFPLYIKCIWRRLQESISELSDFNAVEMCHLEYDSARGSSIEAHFDDFWVWGGRLVTLNYLSTSVLTLTHPTDECVKKFEIAIQMPPRSLLILAGDARYKWLHQIKRSDIDGRRMATTWREFTPEFLPGGSSYDSIGKQVLAISSDYY